MRSYIIVAVVAVCSFSAMIRTALASNIAFDTAGDSAYNNGWTTGSNGGYGWGGGWQISDADYTLPQPPIFGISADPTLGGIMNSPAVADGRVWAMTKAVARRPLAGPLAVGQTISVNLDGAGIEFHSPLFAFGLVADQGSDFTLGEVAFFIGGGLISYIDTGIPMINGPIAVSLTLQSNESYTLDVRSLASPATGGSFSFQFWSGPDEIWLDGNLTSVSYANNLSVTPEPSAFLIAGVAALGLLRRRTRVRSGV